LRDVVFADAARLPFASGSFDVGTTNHVLHLIPVWRDVLKEIARVTRETYFTVIERSDRVESIKREYDALVKAAGHDWSHPGFQESRGSVTEAPGRGRRGRRWAPRTHGPPESRPGSRRSRASASRTQMC